MNGSEREDGQTARSQGILSRHPRLGILVIGALFLIPICVMVATVAVIILSQFQNVQ